MRRRNAIITSLLLLITVAASVGGLGYALKTVPAFYHDAQEGLACDPMAAAAVVTRFGDLKNDIRSKTEWGATFTDAELNAFLQVHLGQEGGFASVVPRGFHAPRLRILGDRIFLAARYGSGFWSTVLSMEMKLWLVKDHTNLVALELCGVRAGILPVGTQSILDRISEASRESNIVITWYRHNGNAVGLCHFYADQPRPTTQIARFVAADGKLTIAGRSHLELPQAVPVVVGAEID